jgi:hypothetical protein
MYIQNNSLSGSYNLNIISFQYTHVKKFIFLAMMAILESLLHVVYLESKPEVLDIMFAGIMEIHVVRAFLYLYVVRS